MDISQELRCREGEVGIAEALPGSNTVRGQSSGPASERHHLGPIVPSPHSPILTFAVGFWGVFFAGGGGGLSHTTTSNTSLSLS